MDKTIALLADEQGLGKTPQSLMALPENSPVLVVCPKIACGVWKAEAAKWRPDYSVLNVGRKNFRFPLPGEIITCTYDSLPKVIKVYPLRGTILIADEAHYVKTSDAQRSIAFRGVAKMTLWRGGRAFLLTGTPMPNNPIELWNMLETVGLGTKAWGSKNKFVKAFNGELQAVTYGNRKVYKYIWGKPTTEAVKGFNKVALRRKKSEVLPDLPPKFHQDIIVPLDRDALRSCEELMKNISSCNLSLEELLNLILEGKGTRGFQIELWAKTRQALAVAKIPSMLEVIEDYEERKTPLVVFSAHRAPIELLQHRDKWATILGDTSQRDRYTNVERFQAGELRGIALTIAAGGVGLTLTRASDVLFVDRSPVPASNQQAEDRLHRITQKSNVLVTTLVGDHPIELRVQEILMRKQALIQSVIG